MTGGANFGNSLQNFAVQEIINSLGYEAHTLNNQTKQGFPDSAKKDAPLYQKLMPKYLFTYHHTMLNYKYGCKNDRDWSGDGLKRAKRNVSEFHAAKKRREERFAAFNRQFICKDENPISAQKLDPEYLSTFFAFVCGSDQVWNPYFQQNSMVDFLQFAPEEKRIAFVPSFGVTEIPESRTAIYSKWLKSIPHLSVREEAGAQIIRELTGRDAPVLLDPTFGLTKEKWLSFARKPKICPKHDYVFCYFLGNKTRQYCKWIEAYAKRHNYEIVDVLDINDLRYYDIDPTEFVWLLANARAVFTDSFHGTAFSINLQIPFLAFERAEGGASMSSRITTLLKKTGLERCLCVGEGSFSDFSCGFSSAEQIILQERAIMLEYIKNALAEVARTTL